jgi:hypothetical protein
MRGSVDARIALGPVGYGPVQALSSAVPAPEKLKLATSSDSTALAAWIQGGSIGLARRAPRSASARAARPAHPGVQGTWRPYTPRRSLQQRPRHSHPLDASFAQRAARHLRRHLGGTTRDVPARCCRCSPIQALAEAGGCGLTQVHPGLSKRACELLTFEDWPEHQGRSLDGVLTQWALWSWPPNGLVIQRAIAPSAAEPTSFAYFWIATSMCSSARGGRS